MSRFINIILIALGVFGLVFTWTYYYVKILWIAYVVGLGLAFVAGVTLFWISRSNKTRKEKKQEDKKKVAALKLKLIMDSDSADIFEENLKVIYPDPDLVKAVANTTLGELRLTKAPANLI